MRLRIWRQRILLLLTGLSIARLGVTLFLLGGTVVLGTVTGACRPDVYNGLRGAPLRRSGLNPFVNPSPEPTG